MEELTSSAASRLLLNPSLRDFGAVMQVLDIKGIGGLHKGDELRYRLRLSDGIRFIHCMVDTKYNEILKGGRVSKKCLIQVDRFDRSEVKGKKRIIIREFEFMKKMEEVIGTPKDIDATGPLLVVPVGQEQHFQGTSEINRICAKATTKGLKTVSDKRSAREVISIQKLTPYSNKWTIKARVIHKSDLKTWCNQKGSGKLCSITMMDETGSIKGTAFKEDAERLFDEIIEDRVFYISRGRVGPAKKLFNTTNNEFEIVFTDSTTFDLCDDEGDIPEIERIITPLARLQELPRNSICDVLGIVTEVGEVKEVLMKRTQRELSKRELTIVDDSGFSCRITLWGKVAEEFEADEQPVVLFRDMKVSDFNGRSLSNQSGSSKVAINPDSDKAHYLRGWFDEIGAQHTFHPCQGFDGPNRTSVGLNHNEVMTLNAAKLDSIGAQKPSFFTVKLRVKATLRKDGTLAYPACGNETCRKKLETRQGKWYCQHCNEEFQAPEWRYITSICLADHRDWAWFSVFNKEGEELFETTAMELQSLKDEGEDKLLDQKLKVPCSKMYYFKCKAQENLVNNKSFVKYTIIRAIPLDYMSEIQLLLDQIKVHCTSVGGNAAKQ